MDLSKFSRLSRELYEEAVPGAELMFYMDIVNEFAVNECYELHGGTVTFHIDDLYLTVPLGWCCINEHQADIVQIRRHAAGYNRSVMRIRFENDMFAKRLGDYDECDDELTPIPTDALHELFNIRGDSFENRKPQC